MDTDGPDKRSYNEHLAGMRVEYREKDNCADLDVDWLDVGWESLLRTWIGDAERAGVAEPNAMVLATVDAGRPVTRSVLCKNLDEFGVSFFTDDESDKAAQLAVTPYASATFPWYQLGRQVHIRGRVTKLDESISAAYWAHRPRESQLGFFASKQSQPIATRAVLLDQLAAATAQFAAVEQVPAPGNWRGYRIAPDVVEFWQGREGRLHNRIRVTGGQIERLQP